MTDNYLVPILIAGTVLLPMFLFFAATFVVISKNKQRRLQMEKKDLQFQYEKQLLHSMLEVEEKGLKILSQELHDNIGQTLTAVHANLIALCTGPHPKAETLLHNSRDQVSVALKNLRNLSHVLNNKYVSKVGLVESLRKEIGYLEAYGSTEFDLTLNDGVDLLPQEKELMIFRIAQEALSNITKHAHATKVKIELYFYPNQFVMQIIDNGVGFGETQKSGEGIGFINMRQRAESMSGSLDVYSSPGGTTLKLDIPL